MQKLLNTVYTKDNVTAKCIETTTRHTCEEMRKLSRMTDVKCY